MIRTTLAIAMAAVLVADLDAAERQQRRRYGRDAIVLKDPAEFPSTQQFSGPQPGESLPPLPAVGIHGELAEKDFDPVELAAGKPQVLVIMEAGGVAVRGLFGMARFSSVVAKKAKNGVHVSAVFLGDDPSQIARSAKNYAGRLAERLDALGISPDGRDGPGAYGLNRNVAQTIIFARDGKVTHNFVFPQGMLYPDPHVLGALAAVVGEERETVASWLREAVEAEAQMRARRQTAAGTSSPQRALRERLGQLVEAGKLTREEAVELYRIAFPQERDR